LKKMRCHVMPLSSAVHFFYSRDGLPVSSQCHLFLFWLAVLSPTISASLFLATDNHLTRTPGWNNHHPTVTIVHDDLKTLSSPPLPDQGAPDAKCMLPSSNGMALASATAHYSARIQHQHISPALSQSLPRVPLAPALVHSLSHF
jgi:hypothetical protein